MKAFNNAYHKYVRKMHNSKEDMRVEAAKTQIIGTINTGQVAVLTVGFVVLVGAVMTDLGIEWDSVQYLVQYLTSPQIDEFYGQPIMKNCEGGCRRGYESSITLDRMEKDGCCLDNTCYDRDELAEYIAFSNGEARLPHNRRPINQQWLNMHCSSHSWTNWIIPSVRRVRRLERRFL